MVWTYKNGDLSVTSVSTSIFGHVPISSLKLNASLYLYSTLQIMIEKCIFKFELSGFYSWAYNMIACTLNWLVNVQGASISNLWWEIHKQVMAGNSTFLWFLCLTTNVIASFTSCVLCSIKCNLVICYICNIHSKLGLLLEIGPMLGLL